MAKSTNTARSTGVPGSAETLRETSVESLITLNKQKNPKSGPRTVNLTNGGNPLAGVWCLERLGDIQLRFLSKLAGRQALLGVVQLSPELEGLSPGWDHRRPLNLEVGGDWDEPKTITDERGFIQRCIKNPKGFVLADGLLNNLPGCSSPKREKP